MKKVDKEVLKEVADKLHINLSEEEYEMLFDMLETINKEMEVINHIEGIDDVEPMTFPFDVSNSFLREDKSVTPLNREEALKNASDVIDGQISLPKVIG